MTSGEIEPNRPTKRRRRRAGAPQGEPPPAVSPAALPDDPPAPAQPQAKSPKARNPKARNSKAGNPKAQSPHDGQRRHRRPRETGEHGMRELAGSGPTQLNVSAALRARDVNRPNDEDLAAAERDVAIVRRNWQPPR